MNPTTELAVICAVLFFVVGILLFVRYFPWPKKVVKPLYMKVVFDVSDHAAFNAIMAVISSYDLVDAVYEETDDVAYAMIGVVKEDYQPIYKSLIAIQNVEVI